MDPIITAALSARTNADVNKLEAMLVQALGARTRFLGDQEANWSSVSSPADPVSVLFERATNMFDAVIEREAETRKQRNLASPAAAAHSFFGVPKEGVGEMPGKDRERLAADCLLSVLDSDDPRNKPTFAFRDRGVGLTPTEMPDTILSLQQSNKLRKAYAHGIFGKGGSSTSAFSDATIIVARKQPALLDGAEDRIGVAVVHEDEAADMGLPFLRYNVGADDLPYSVPATDYPQFEAGVYVAHVNYQAGKMGVQNWTNEESIYAYAETILFNPTLPYQLNDARTGAANQRPEDRQKPSVVSGLRQRLEGLKPDDGNIIERSDWQTVAVAGAGDVRLRWWLFKDPDKRRTRVAKGYVVAFTLNGQVHHAWDNPRFQQLIERRRRVGQRLFVEVECDAIELRMRPKVFDSFRAQVRRGPEGRALEAAVVAAIESDPDLDEAEDAFVKETLTGATQRISAAFRKRLNAALKSKVPGLIAGKGTGPGRPPRPPKAKRPEELYDEPTTFTGPEEVTLLLGGRATVFMEANAVDGFVPNKGNIDLEGAGLLPLKSLGDLRKGRLQLTLEAVPGMVEGEVEIDVVLTWVRKNGGLGRLPWQIKLDVVTKIEPRAPTKPTGTGPKPANDGGDVALIWVQDPATYPMDMVGELTELKGDLLASKNPDYADLKGVEDLVTTIVLNVDFAEWRAYLRSIGKNASDAALDIRRERYALASGVVIANLMAGEKKIGRKHLSWEAKQNGTEEPPTPMSDEQQRRALAEAAQGIIALMPDFDVLLNDLND